MEWREGDIPVVQRLGVLTHPESLVFYFSRSTHPHNNLVLDHKVPCSKATVNTHQVVKGLVPIFKEALPRKPRLQIEPKLSESIDSVFVEEVPAHADWCFSSCPMPLLMDKTTIGLHVVSNVHSFHVG